MNEVVLNTKDVIIEYYKDIDARFGFFSRSYSHRYNAITLLSDNVKVLSDILSNKYSRYSEYGISVSNMNDHVFIHVDRTFLKDEYKIIYKIDKDVLSSLILNDIGKN